eukprot:gene3597-4623_t
MLRHGETAWNTERRMQGSKNSDLTPRGRVQALAMGRTLKAELEREPGPTIFLRSPLGRTRETSEIVGRELGIASGEWREDIRLAELSYGTWEGFSWAEIEIDHPTALADWRAVQAPPVSGSGDISGNTKVMFRTATAPLRPGSFSLVGEMEDGTPINVTAGTNGKIDGARVKGTINVDNGVVEL